METLKDWFDFADRASVLAEYRTGPQPLDEIAPGQWGIRGVGVICIGDAVHMMKVQAKRFSDRFHKTPCPLDQYAPGYCAPKSVAMRLGVL